MKITLTPAIATLALFAFGAIQTEAQIIFSDPSGATPVATGLDDNVYHNVPQGSPISVSAPFTPSGPPSDSDVSLVEGYAAMTAPTYTFLNANTGFNYTTDGNTAQYLGADAAGAALTDSSSMGNTILDALGFINVSTADVGQTYSFTINEADDAGRVLIGGNGTPGSGTMIVEQNYGNSLSPSTQTVEFTQAGLYDIEVLTYQTDGGYNFQLSTSVTGPGSVVFDVGPVPEPSTWALLSCGLGALILLQRRARRSLEH